MQFTPSPERHRTLAICQQFSQSIGFDHKRVCNVLLLSTWNFLDAGYMMLTRWRQPWLLGPRPTTPAQPEITQGGHKVGQKNYLSFPAFSRAINLLFRRLSQQKVNVIMTFIKGHDDPVYPVNSCFTQIFEWQTKNTLFVTIFPWGCTEFPEFSTFREILEYSRFSRFVATLLQFLQLYFSTTSSKKS